MFRDRDTFLQLINGREVIIDECVIGDIRDLCRTSKASNLVFPHKGTGDNEILYFARHRRSTILLTMDKLLFQRASSWNLPAIHLIVPNGHAGQILMESVNIST